MDVDLFVIGGGSGGVRAARIAAQHGARVALAESGRMGGTCVNVGCVPKKLFSYGSQYREEFEDAVGYGWDHTEPGFDWRKMVAAKDVEIGRLNGIYHRMLGKAGVQIHEGRATVTGPHEVEVADQRISAQHILVATGGKPVRPDIPGAELGWVSDDVFELAEMPERLVVVGGGYIACEFASVFRSLGVDVVLVVRSVLLRGFDKDVRQHVQQEMEKKGVQFVIGEGCDRLDRVGDTLTLALRSGETIEGDAVLFATGRKPNSDGIGLEALGVALKDNGAIEVDDRYRTSVPSILAVGDVIDRIQLTPVALAEGMFVARDLFGGEPRAIDYAKVATAVFTNPNVATVGMTEEDARERGEVRLFKSAFRPLKHTISGRDARTYMKLVVDADTDRVLGCHMVGPHAGELVQGFAVALVCNATKAQLDATIGIHPTAAEEFVTMRTEWTP